MVKIVAHRGNSSAAPENTMAAFKSALDAGIRLVELDVHLSGDGQVIVMHDADVRRTTNGSGSLGNMTLAEIKELDAGTWFSPQFAGEKVPTLREVLNLIRGRAGVYIEIKDEDKILADKVLKLLADTGMSENAVIISFIEKSLARVKELAPEQITSLLSCNPDIIERAIELNTDGISPAHGIVDRQFVEKAHKAGFFVAVWTVDEPEDLQRMLEAGVDTITSNKPETIKALLG
jgi:glycerophosphoryl diester phosphodiesterase